MILINSQNGKNVARLTNGDQSEVLHEVSGNLGVKKYQEMGYRSTWTIEKVKGIQETNYFRVNWFSKTASPVLIAIRIACAQIYVIYPILNIRRSRHGVAIRLREFDEDQSAL